MTIRAHTLMLDVTPKALDEDGVEGRPASMLLLMRQLNILRLYQSITTTRQAKPRARRIYCMET